MRILFFVISLCLFSCTENKPDSNSTTTTTTENIETKTLQPDTISSRFKLSGIKDTMQNGEEFVHFKSGALQAKGLKKNGKREGVWKCWYEDGTPWSETTFVEGKKTGKTTTWYENGKKRYEGFYTNDVETGKWIFWNEKGEVVDTKIMDLK